MRNMWEDLDEAGDIETLNSDKSSLLVEDAFPPLYLYSISIPSVIDISTYF